MIEKLTDVISTLKSKINDARSVYEAKRKERFALNDAIREIEDTPPARSDLERFLHLAIDQYEVWPGRELLKVSANGARCSATPEDEKEKVDIIARGFLNYPNDYGLMALLKPALHAGATDFAARCEWPEKTLSNDERAKQLEQLNAKRQVISNEETALREQLEKAGVKLD